MSPAILLCCHLCICLWTWATQVLSKFPTWMTGPSNAPLDCVSVIGAKPVFAAWLCITPALLAAFCCLYLVFCMLYIQDFTCLPQCSAFGSSFCRMWRRGPELCGSVSPWRDWCVNTVLPRYSVLVHYSLKRHRYDAAPRRSQLNYFTLQAVTYTFYWLSLLFYTDIIVTFTEVITCNSSHPNSVYLIKNWEIAFAVLRFQSADQSSQTFH